MENSDSHGNPGMEVQGNGWCTLVTRALRQLPPEREILVITHGRTELLLRPELLILASSRHMTLVVDDTNRLADMQSRLDLLPPEYPLRRRGPAHHGRAFPQVLVIGMLQHCTVAELMQRLVRVQAREVHVCDYVYPSPQDAPGLHRLIRLWHRQVPVMDMLDTLTQSPLIQKPVRTLQPPNFGMGTYVDLGFTLGSATAPPSQDPDMSVLLDAEFGA